MFEVTIYYKDGRRSVFVDCDGIDDNDYNIGLSFITDHGERLYNDIPSDRISEIKVKIIGDLHE